MMAVAREYPGTGAAWGTDCVRLAQHVDKLHELIGRTARQPSALKTARFGGAFLMGTAGLEQRPLACEAVLHQGRGGTNELEILRKRELSDDCPDLVRVIPSR